MPQITIYLDEETDRVARKAAAGEGKSVSAWIGALIRQRTADEWPADVLASFGTWKDVDPEDFEIQYPPDLPREKW